jgi:hypothetical protein
VPWKVNVSEPAHAPGTMEIREDSGEFEIAECWTDPRVERGEGDGPTRLVLNDKMRDNFGYFDAEWTAFNRCKQK